MKVKYLVAMALAVASSYAACFPSARRSMRKRRQREWGSLA